MTRFCSDCQNILRTVDQIFTDGLFDDSVHDVYASNLFTGRFEGWVKAATEGTCDLCVMTYFPRYTNQTNSLLDEIPNDDEMFWQLKTTFGEWVQLALRSSIGHYLGIDVYFQRRSMTDEQVLQLKALGGEAGSSTWGPRTVKALRNWIYGCISSHDQCKVLSESALPKRLLDVSPSGITADVPVTIGDINSLTIDALPQVKLCQTSDFPSTIKYLTLSHCWGKSVSMKLSNEFLPVYAHQIPLCDLLSSEAKVFREAIWVTRCLGYRYLWIDALCINQEDENEKSVEISRMDQIFSGGTVNLSATSASSGADGMIFNRKYNLYGLFRCLPGQDVTEEPVNKRAWVFQGRILAPRVIYFCRDDILRECTGEIVPELSDYSPWIIAIKLHGSFGIKLPSESMVGIDEISTEKKAWCYRFRVLIQQYSSTLLTFPEDRLASIAGIAKAISIRGGVGEDQYFAGLWAHDLPRALVSQARNHVGKGKWNPEHFGYISPSWSWASCEAHALLYAWKPSDPWESLVTVSRVWTIPATPGSVHFGALRDGAMVLKGKAVQIHRKRISDAFLISIRDGHPKFAEELYFEARRPRKPSELNEDMGGKLKEVMIYWDRFTRASERETLPARQIDVSMDWNSWAETEPEVLYLLPVGQATTREPFDEENSLVIEGLVWTVMTILEAGYLITS
ncbi:unnamed protein product [Fusarium equiseti]|uniref:Heterokaryon incompatibility domain-containing protein n=1 Tax=Fusarium equiseti TaxID=61235 RepID=A0A8J2IE47_FUSEQ|nr:unnamed protein product [Fusarium equiseti]